MQRKKEDAWEKEKQKERQQELERQLEEANEVKHRSSAVCCSEQFFGTREWNMRNVSQQ